MPLSSINRENIMKQAILIVATQTGAGNDKVTSCIASELAKIPQDKVDEKLLSLSAHLSHDWDNIIRQYGTEGISGLVAEFCSTAAARVPSSETAMVISVKPSTIQLGQFEVTFEWVSRSVALKLMSKRDQKHTKRVLKQIESVMNTSKTIH